MGLACLVVIWASPKLYWVGQIDIINESAFEQLDQACEALLVAEKKKNFVDTEDDTEDEVTIDNQDGPEDSESEDSDESSEQHELEYPKANQKNLAKTTKKVTQSMTSIW